MGTDVRKRPQQAQVWAFPEVGRTHRSGCGGNSRATSSSESACDIPSMRSTCTATRVLAPMEPLAGESPETFARRVEQAMQTALTELAGDLR